MQSRTAWAGAFGALAIVCTSQAEAAVVRDVRVLRDATTTRIVVDVDGPVRWRSHPSEDGKAILVDLDNADLDADVPRLLPVSDRRVDGVLMQDDPQSRIVRVSVDFAGRTAPSLEANLDGAHLVLDFRAASSLDAATPHADAAGLHADAEPRRAGEAAAKQPAPEPRLASVRGRETREPETTQSRELKIARARARARAAEADAEAGPQASARREIAVAPPAKEPARPAPAPAKRSVLEKAVVVLDPGHGGKDPGARAWTGEVEKDIVLDLAERVARRLRTRGDVEVVMTRSGDEFVELADRRETSRRWGADVFVSIHANASHNAAARGIETYYHSRTTGDRGMRRLVRAENGGAAGKGAQASRSGASAAMSKASLSRSSAPVLDRRSESIRLAKDVQGELVRQLGMRYEAVRDLGAKEGPFFVIGENAAPSVLVEAAFLTHREEGLRMRSEVYREQIADGVARGILAFLDHQRRAGTL